MSIVFLKLYKVYNAQLIKIQKQDFRIARSKFCYNINRF